MIYKVLMAVMLMATMMLGAPAAMADMSSSSGSSTAGSSGSAVSSGATTGQRMNENPTSTDKPNIVENPVTPAIPFHIQTPSKGCAFHPNDPKCVPDSNGNCPSGFSHNSKGNCFPSGKCPSGFSRHTDDESGKCFSNRGHGHNTKTIIIHKTVHRNQIAGVATVFVPGIGLVQPFNCKLNPIANKIGCEFLIVNAIS